MYQNVVIEKIIDFFHYIILVCSGEKVIDKRGGDITYSVTQYNFDSFIGKNCLEKFLQSPYSLELIVNHGNFLLETDLIFQISSDDLESTSFVGGYSDIIHPPAVKGKIQKSLNYAHFSH